jgi:hypothetical protein
MLTQLTYWSPYYTMTHFSVLYLDMDLPIYKTASDVPKTSDLSWLLS